jgi:hypothetical protein
VTTLRRTPVRGVSILEPPVQTTAVMPAVQAQALEEASAEPLHEMTFEPPQRVRDLVIGAMIGLGVLAIVWFAATAWA